MSVGALSPWLAAPLPAQAANQFTIDAKASTFGSVVVDAAGSGYVTWNHEGSNSYVLQARAGSAQLRASDRTVRAREAGIRLSQRALRDPRPRKHGVGGGLPLRPGRHADLDLHQRGQTFGAPYEIPYIPNCPEVGPCNLSFSYAGRTNTEDMLPITNGYAAYQGQVYRTEKGQLNVYWTESSNNPGLGFNIDNTGEITGGPEGATEFTFETPGAEESAAQPSA